MQNKPDRLRSDLLIFYERSGTLFEDAHLAQSPKNVTERGRYGLGLSLIDTFAVLYAPVIYRTIDIDAYTNWQFVYERQRIDEVSTYNS